MLRLGSRSRRTPAEVVQRAEDFFGPGGLGLRVAERAPARVVLEGGGGGVAVTAEAGVSGSSVDVVSSEWDVQAREFLDRPG